MAEEWFAEVRASVGAGDRSPGTGRLYRDRLDRQVLPAIGSVRLREVRVSQLDRLLRAVRENHGVGVAKATRTVLSGVFGLAARHDAVPGNLVRDVAPIPGSRSRKGPKRALALGEVWDLRGKLARSVRAVGLDVPDLVDMMMATGLRIGEAAAVTWPAVDLGAGTVEVRGTVVRITGVGLVIKPVPKSAAGWRVVELPGWAVEMLRRRRRTATANTWDVVFTSPAGRLRDPSNTQSDLRALFDAAGYPGVTSHTFRRTVATLMDTAGLSARAAADQLGHAKVSMTQDHYYGRHVARTGAADVLARVVPDHPDPTRNVSKSVHKITTRPPSRHPTCNNVGPVGIEPTTRGS